LTDDPHDFFGNRPDGGAAPDQRKTLEAKAADYDAVRKAVDDAGSFVRGLWVTYVSLGTYIVVAAASVTHRQLFLETPIKLPLLDVQLPLVAFFVVAPWFFLIFHFYLLLQLTLLAGKIGHYNALLWSALPPALEGASPERRLAAASDDLLRDQLRQQLPNDLLVQFLAGPRAMRERGLGRMLRLVAWATMVVGPLIVLLLVQYKFLPYQDEVTTWMQRAAVLVDLALLWRLWPAVASGRGALYWPKSWKALAGGLASLTIVAASLFALTFPRETMDETPLARAFHGVMVWPIEASAQAETEPKEWEKPERRAVATGCRAADVKALKTCWEDASKLRRLLGARVEWRQASLIEEKVWLALTPAARRVVAGTLRLREESFVDDEKLAKIEARARELKLAPHESERTLRIGPRKLVAADLTAADLRRADMRGANIDETLLRGAKLDGVQLDNASAMRAALDEAQLQGASLDRAQLQGASLDRAQLQGASLKGAQLQGASLKGAQLQGASLNLAQLHGASLDWAQLQGASLHWAQLQGASLNGAKLQGASLDWAYCYRASPAPERGTFAGTPRLGRESYDFLDRSKPLTDAMIEAWRVEWRKVFGDWSNTYVGKQIDKVIDARFGRLLEKSLDPKEDKALADAWTAASGQNFDSKAFTTGLIETACARDAAPYVARGILGSSTMLHAGEYIARFAAALRAGRADPAKCLGVVGFTEADWKYLDIFSPPPAMKKSPSR
jgi:uncharacterized protein YjbI with pentapeptide repeats